jgi:hypothetical protein
VKCHLKFFKLEEDLFGGSRPRRHQIHAVSHAKSATPCSIYNSKQLATQQHSNQDRPVPEICGLQADLERHAHYTKPTRFKKIKLKAIARARSTKNACSEQEGDNYGGHREPKVALPERWIRGMLRRWNTKESDFSDCLRWKIWVIG